MSRVDGARPTHRTLDRRKWLIRAAALAWAPASLGAAEQLAELRHGRLAEPTFPHERFGQSASAGLGAPVRVVTLAAELDHPQGLEVSADGATWWVSSVHRPRKAGLLGAFDADTGQTRRLVEIHEGDCYHPGGLSRHGDELWIPVAEYRRASRTLVQCREAATLVQRTAFEVADHIGCLAADATRLVGANWDAHTFYAWDHRGLEQLHTNNPTAARYQDLKWDGPTLVAGGLLDDHGVVDRLAWPSLELLARVEVGRTDRDVVLTHEGLALIATTLLLMPEDDPVRVFAFRRPRALG